jgi:hypothetical protein
MQNLFKQKQKRTYLFGRVGLVLECSQARSNRSRKWRGIAPPDPSLHIWLGTTPYSIRVPVIFLLNQ